MSASSSPDLTLPGGARIGADELNFEFSRGGGPGGQNVNKVETRVTLRFAPLHSPAFSARQRERLARALAGRLTGDGEIVIHAAEHRSQSRNREAALARLRALLIEALAVPKTRKPTRPTRGSVERRIAAARRRGAIKRLRRKPPGDE